MSNPQKPLSNYQWFPFINNSGETIPPFSIFQIDGIDTTGNQVVYKAIKPTWAGAQYAVNGPIQVTAGKRGECCLSPVFIVKYTGTVVVNDFVGPVAATWTVARGVGTFKVLGIGDSTNRLASVRIPESNAIHAQAPADGIPGRIGMLEGSATCELLTNNATTGMLELTGVSVTIKNGATSAISANGDRHVWANWINGRWKAISEDCGDEGSESIMSGSSSMQDVPADYDDAMTPMASGGVFNPLTVTFHSGVDVIPD